MALNATDVVVSCIVCVVDSEVVVELVVVDSVVVEETKVVVDVDETVGTGVVVELVVLVEGTKVVVVAGTQTYPLWQYNVAGLNKVVPIHV